MNTEIPERIVPGTQNWNKYYSEHIQRYEFASDYCANKNVLDVACGVGYGSHLLSLKGAKTVLGIDISPEAIQYAINSYCAEGIQFIQGDVCQLTLNPNSFDVAVSFETIEHISCPEQFIIDIYHALKPGGIFICSTPNKDFEPILGKKEDNPYHVLTLSLEEFEELILEKFIIKFRYFQSHSESFIRHQLLVSELSNINKAIRFSIFMRFEAALRRLIGKETWNTDHLASGLQNFIPGDMQIRELLEASPHILTYILVMEKAG